MSEHKIQFFGRVLFLPFSIGKKCFDSRNSDTFVSVLLFLTVSMDC